MRGGKKEKKMRLGFGIPFHPLFEKMISSSSSYNIRDFLPMYQYTHVMMSTKYNKDQKSDIVIA